MTRPRFSRWLALAAVLAIVTAVYSNHFSNSFHFDDAHSVVGNPYIRDLRNVPRFFVDARTFTILPRNRAYRPVVSTALAFDYWLGGGLDPFYFHLSTFVLFLLQLAIMYALFLRLCELTLPDARNRWVALAATACYGLHPVMAETVNYIVQRGDLYCTLGVVAALAIYARWPKLRPWGLYLLPFAAAVLSKPPALIFPGILFFYIWLFEFDARPRDLGRAAVRTIPALLATAALLALTIVMIPREFHPGISSRSAFLLTQPLVTLRFFRAFFLPDSLTADTDHHAVSSVWEEGAWAGFLFVAALIAAGVAATRIRECRPAAFGLIWFLLALAPTALFPVFEVENDHRMFFPFVGLVLAVAWAIALWIYHSPPRPAMARILAVLCLCQFALLAFGTRERNRVWHTEESLWRDVTVKSPRNGRGLMNYAIAREDVGDLATALAGLERAAVLAPYEPRVWANLAVVESKAGRPESAEAHFRRALHDGPRDIAVYLLYARWLDSRNREKEALDLGRRAAMLNPDALETRYFIMHVLARQSRWSEIDTMAAAILSRFPAEPEARAWRLMTAWQKGQHPAATADAFLNASALYYQAAMLELCIAAARQAIQLRPAYAEAYNNVAAAYMALGRRAPAIAAAREALRIRPDYEPAQKNLTRAKALP